jgi:hypothetical protein
MKKVSALHPTALNFIRENNERIAGRHSDFLDNDAPPNNADASAHPVKPGSGSLLLRSLEADQLGKLQKTRTKREGYINRAKTNGYDISTRIDEKNKLKGAANILALGKRAEHVLDRAGYNMFSIGTIIISPPGATKLLSAMDASETARLKHRKQPFDKNTSAVRHEIYKTYSSTEGSEEEKLAAAAKKFAVNEEFVREIAATKGMVALEEIPITSDTSRTGTGEDAGTNEPDDGEIASQ